MGTLKTVALTLCLCVWWVVLRPAGVDEKVDFVRRLNCSGDVAGAHQLKARIDRKPSASLVRVWWEYMRVKAASPPPRDRADGIVMVSLEVAAVEEAACRIGKGAARGT